MKLVHRLKSQKGFRPSEIQPKAKWVEHYYLWSFGWLSKCQEEILSCEKRRKNVKIHKDWTNIPLWILGADATGRLRRLGLNICLQLTWLHVGAVLTVELCWIQVGPCWVHVGATWSSVGTTSAHVRSKLWLVWPILGLWLAERVYVGPFWNFVGAMLAHLRSMLGPSSPILSYVGAMAVLFSCCHLQSQILLKICLFSTSPQWPARPVACKSVWGELWPSKGRVAAFSKKCSPPAQWRFLKPFGHVGRVTRPIWTVMLKNWL